MRTVSKFEFFFWYESIWTFFEGEKTLPCIRSLFYSLELLFREKRNVYFLRKQNEWNKRNFHGFKFGLLMMLSDFTTAKPFVALKTWDIFSRTCSFYCLLSKTREKSLCVRQAWNRSFFGSYFIYFCPYVLK